MFKAIQAIAANFYGVFMALVLVLVTVFFGLGVFLFAIPKALLPWPRWQRWMTYGVDAFAMGWARAIGTLAQVMLPTRWEIRGGDQIRRDATYLLAANHQSWNDLVAMIVAFCGRIAPYRLFIKAPLIWLPIVGQACWAMDAAFMKRYSREEMQADPNKAGRDLRVAQRTFERSAHKSVAVFNFIEGTRITRKKHAERQSPYRHLLSPRAGGVAFAMQAMGKQLDAFVDVTFAYPYGAFELWQLLCGRVRHVVVSIRVLDIPAEFRGMDYGNPQTKAAFQAWVTEIWDAKDAQLESILSAEQGKTPAVPSFELDG